MSATTTVTLSGAPARMAAPRAGRPWRRRDVRPRAPLRWCPRPRSRDRPSEQSRNRSPVRASRTMRSGSSPSLPVRTRVTRERRGWLSASSSVMRPSSTRDCTKEWSWVIWLNFAPQEVSPRVTDVGGATLLPARRSASPWCPCPGLEAVVDLRLDLAVGGRNGPAEVVGRVVATVALLVEVTMVPMAMELAMSPPAWLSCRRRPRRGGAGIPGVLVLRADQSHVGAGCVVERDLHAAVVSSSARRQSCRSQHGSGPPPRVR